MRRAFCRLIPVQKNFQGEPQRQAERDGKAAVPLPFTVLHPLSQRRRSSSCSMEMTIVLIRTSKAKLIR